MRKHFKMIGMLALMVVPFFGAIAQEDSCKAKLESGADIMSRYVWRGKDFGSSPSIQPSLKLSLGNFAIGTWGAFAVNNYSQFQEADLYLSYTWKEKAQFIFTDYFFPNETPGAKNNYFEYNDTLTSHVFETTLSWLGTDKLPLSLLVATNFYGFDARHDDGSLFYSTYIELGYSGSLNGTDYNLFAGFTPNKPTQDDKDAFITSGYYGETMGFVNLGVKAKKNVQITEEFSLPMTTSLIVNPMAENIFLVFGFTL